MLSTLHLPTLYAEHEAFIPEPIHDSILSSSNGGKKLQYKSLYSLKSLPPYM